MAKVVKLFGKRGPDDDTEQEASATPHESVTSNADGTVTIELDLDAETMQTFERLERRLGGSQEAGIRESNVAERMRLIKEEGLDLEACRRLGGAWAVAADRIEGRTSAGVVSSPPPSVTSVLDRVRRKGRREE